MDGRSAAPPAQPAASPGRGGRGAIYRIRPDGLWDTVLGDRRGRAVRPADRAGGSLLVGTGTEGKIFRVSGNPARATLLARATARQVTALLREPSGRDRRRHEQSRESCSRCRPARRASGTLRIRRARRRHGRELGRDPLARDGAPGQVQSSRASGNTATPDETWSAWSKAYTNADGEQIASPNARYLQWRAVLTGDGAPCARS